MWKKKTEKMDSLSKTESIKVKQWIKLASIAITLVVIGQEGDKDEEEEGEDAEEEN